MKMKYINRTIYLFLVLSLCLHTSTAIATDFSGNGDGTVWVVRGQENSTAPGGFSAVAEPAGPVDPEAAKRAAEEYAQKCIEPKILAIASMGLIPGPPEECAAQVNTGAPYPNYTVSHPWETQ